MSHRYSLRFESGARAGEVVPITGASFTVGRKPGNSLQIVEPSVSGKHAELTLADGVARLRDLGSTNGTRVGGEPITESVLAAGTSLHIGQVPLTFLDGEVAEVAGGAEPALEVEAAQTVTAENLARSRKKGSKLGLVALGVIAAGGGGALYYLEQGGGSEQQRLRPVREVSGNLIAEGFSFEEPVGWGAVEDLPVTFRSGTRSRYSGAEGLSASVAEEEAAEHRSEPVAVRAGTGLVARARLRVTDGAAARLGIVFLPATKEDSTPAETVIWSPVSTDTSGWAEVEVGATVPGGYDRALVALRADALDPEGGRVDADDASLVPGPGAVAVRIGKADFYLDGGNLTLFEIDRVMLSGFQVHGVAGAALGAALEDEGNGARFRPAGAGRLVLRVESPALEGGMATHGAGGDQAREGEFEADDVTDVLVGSSHDLIRLAFGEPVEVRASRVDGGALDVQVALGADTSPLVQLVFEEERRRVIALTAEAGRAEASGDLGGAMARWQELLDEVPFDAPAVARAQVERARLLQAGFEEAAALSAEVERARFFRLVDLYRQCRSLAEEIGARYAGSEVEETTRELIAGIDQDLSGLEADLDRHEVLRLGAILMGLQAQGSTGLAGEVERYLTEKFEGVQ